MYISRSGRLLPLSSTRGFCPLWAYLGHLGWGLPDVPPQPNSPPNAVPYASSLLPDWFHCLLQAVRIPSRDVVVIMICLNRIPTMTTQESYSRLDPYALVLNYTVSWVTWRVLVLPYCLKIVTCQELDQTTSQLIIYTKSVTLLRLTRVKLNRVFFPR